MEVLSIWRKRVSFLLPFWTDVDGSIQFQGAAMFFTIAQTSLWKEWHPDEDSSSTRYGLDLNCNFHNLNELLTWAVLRRCTNVLGHISLITVGRSWVLPRKKTIFGGPFTHNNGSCLGMSRVCSLTIFVPKPAISTLEI